MNTQPLTNRIAPQPLSPDFDPGRSTSTILNDAARRAGVERTDQNVTVTGHDPTYADEKAGLRDDAERDLYAGLAEASAEHALSAIGDAFVHELTAGVHTTVDCARLLVRAWKEGDDLEAATRRDGMHWAVNHCLDGLPYGWMQSQSMKAHEGVVVWEKTERVLLGSRDQQILQARCDDGMRTARQMLDAHLAPPAFFAQSAKLAERFHTDAAFRAGFDAMVWAHAHEPPAYQEALQLLDARDGSAARHAGIQG